MAEAKKFFFPPFHPGCRCTIIAIRDISDYVQRQGPAPKPSANPSFELDGKQFMLNANGRIVLAPAVPEETPKYGTFTSFDDIAAFYKNRVLDLNVDYESFRELDEEVAVKMLNQFERLRERFGIDKFAGLQMTANGWQYDDVLGRTDLTSGFIRLNLNKFKDGKFALADVAEDGGWFASVKPGTSRAEYILTHEFGHALGTTMNLRGTDFNIDTQFDALLKAAADGKIDLNALLSEYGKTSADEMFAEIFAKVTLSDTKVNEALLNPTVEKLMSLQVDGNNIPSLPPAKENVQPLVLLDKYTVTNSVTETINDDKLDATGKKYKRITQTTDIGTVTIDLVYQYGFSDKKHIKEIITYPDGSQKIIESIGMFENKITKIIPAEPKPKVIETVVDAHSGKVMSSKDKEYYTAEDGTLWKKITRDGIEDPKNIKVKDGEPLLSDNKFLADFEKKYIDANTLNTLSSDSGTTQLTTPHQDADIQPTELQQSPDAVTEPTVLPKKPYLRYYEKPSNELATGDEYADSIQSAMIPSKDAKINNPKDIEELPKSPYLGSKNPAYKHYSLFSSDAMRQLEGFTGFEEWRDNLTEDELQSLKKYAGESYGDINGALRGQKRMKKDTKVLIKHIDTALSYELEENIVTYRGIKHLEDMLPSIVDDVEAAMKEKDVSAYVQPKIGTEFILDKGYMSTSIALEIGKNFARENPDGVIIKLHLNKGTTVGVISKGIAAYDSESEILLGRSKKVKLLSFEKVERGYFMEVLILDK